MLIQELNKHLSPAYTVIIRFDKHHHIKQITSRLCLTNTLLVNDIYSYRYVRILVGYVSKHDSCIAVGLSLIMDPPPPHQLITVVSAASSPAKNPFSTGRWRTQLLDRVLRVKWRQFLCCLKHSRVRIVIPQRIVHND